MTAHPDELERRDREVWRRAADGWDKWQGKLRELSGPVSEWMVSAVAPEPGQLVLDLAAGPGETGFVAAQRIGPSGTLISSDQAEEMVAVARRRAAELGLPNVRFEVFDAQQIELESGSVDVVLCRWGYMLVARPAAALRETRRVLRKGGRVALAVWDRPERNLWMAAPAMALVSRGALPMPDPGAPGPFSMADAERLEQQLAEAGFSGIEVARIEYPSSYSSFEQYWEMSTDLAAPIAAALAALEGDGAIEVREAVRGVLGQFEAVDGSLAVPASTIVAAATA
jgi:SAM-dependent methyltransferase